MTGAEDEYSAEVLAPIVASSNYLAEVIRALGLKPTGGNHRFIQSRIRQAGLDTSHFGARLRTRIESIPIEELEQLVRDHRSPAAILERLGLPTEGRAHSELKRRLLEHALDTSHFTGRGWSRGHTVGTHPSVEPHAVIVTRTCSSKTARRSAVRA